MNKIVAGSCLARSILVRGFGCRRYKEMTWVFDKQPDLAVHLRATLPFSCGEALAPTYWNYSFFNVVRVGKISVECCKC